MKKILFLSGLSVLTLSIACTSKQRPATRVSDPPAPVTQTSKLLLETFSFETVTLDEKGTVTARKPGSARCFKEDLGKGVVLELVEIPGGTFLMGSPESEALRSPAEGPQHQVTVPTFYMGKFEVTQAQWREIAKLPRYRDELDPDPSQFKGANLPVEYVFWDKAMEFCARLSAKTGRQYRLPTEAEWEYAARAGTTTPFSTGPTITTEFANINGNFPYAEAPRRAGRESTLPVGSLGTANSFGLYDMHGNVWEWCLDEWHPNYVGAPTNGAAWGKVDFEPVGEEEEETHEDEERQRVMRGGSWTRRTTQARSGFRFQTKDDTRASGLGFRVVLIPVK